MHADECVTVAALRTVNDVLVINININEVANKNLAIANRSRVSWEHNMSRASTITP